MPTKINVIETWTCKNCGSELKFQPYNCALPDNSNKEKMVFVGSCPMYCSLKNGVYLSVSKIEDTKK